MTPSVRRVTAPPQRTGARAGFSLLEVLVALVVLEVCLLGVMGLLRLAAHEIARAVLLERVAAEAAEVADSLARSTERRSGESLRGDWRIRWEVVEDEGFHLSARLARAPRADAVLELRVP
jgi:prepilin-type N-terminal cleavage/methylation domain-containing protein